VLYRVLELDRPQHDCSAAYVIVQQYSFLTFVLLRLPFHKLRFGARINMLLFIFFFFNIIIIIFSGTAAQHGLWPPRPRGFLITHNDAPQLVKLLWMSEQLVAETST
jgi:hypothetical protein